MPKENTSFEGFIVLQEGCGEGVKRDWEGSVSEGSKSASIPQLISVPTITLPYRIILWAAACLHCQNFYLRFSDQIHLTSNKDYLLNVDHYFVYAVAGFAGISG